VGHSISSQCSGSSAGVDRPAVVGEWWRRWPDANLGLVTGRRFDVLDLDGDLGVEARRAVLSITPVEHSGPVPRTGGGGWHVLYRLSGLGNRVRLLAGGGLAGPGWAGGGPTLPACQRPPLPLGPAPDGDAARRPGRAAAAANPTGDGADHPPQLSLRPTVAAAMGGRRWRGERAAVAAAEPSRRNATLSRAAFNLGQLVARRLLEVDEVRTILLAAALEAGTPETKARATIESGLRGGAAKPRCRRDGAP
jgi:hypothetical protein